ncbi:MAG: ABC transporter permease subunit, partial [Actinomycetota bacterium]
MIIKKELRQNLWKVVAGFLVLMVVAVFSVASFPVIKQVFSKGPPPGLKLPPQAREQFAALTDFKHYVVSQWFNKNLLQLGFILAVLLGIGAIAGEIQAKTAEFLLSKPISRTRAILEKYCTLCCILFAAVLVSSILVYPTTLIIKEQISIVRVLLAILPIFPALLVVYSYTLFFSTIFNDQIKTAGAAIGLSVIFIILGVFEKTQKFSIFYYADATKVLLKGQIPWANILGLLAFA